MSFTMVKSLRAPRTTGAAYHDLNEQTKERQIQIMSGKYKNNTSLTPIIATIIVALAAIVLAIAAILTLDKKNNEPTPSGAPSSSTPVENVFHPSQDFIDECTYAAHDLVRDSYSILRLFVTEGLPHFDEPYGNEPEDGIYSVNSTEYTSLSQIEELVRSVYVPAEAKRILTDIDGNGLAVYLEREVLTEAQTAESGGTNDGPGYVKTKVLGINAGFKPDTAYAKDWSSCSIMVMPRSEQECDLKIYLDGLQPETGTAEDTNSEESSKSILVTSMVKDGDEWRLTEFVY